MVESGLNGCLGAIVVAVKVFLYVLAIVIIIGFFL